MIVKENFFNAVVVGILAFLFIASLVTAFFLFRKLRATQARLVIFMFSIVLYCLWCLNLCCFYQFCRKKSICGLKTFFIGCASTSTST